MTYVFGGTLNVTQSPYRCMLFEMCYHLEISRCFQITVDSYLLMSYDSNNFLGLLSFVFVFLQCSCCEESHSA